MRHDFWIGDRVWIASLQQAGIFEGEQGELAIVKVFKEKQLLPFADISLLPEEDDDFTLEDMGIQSKGNRKDMSDFPDTIDLHIEELNPKLMHAEPAQILAHQRARLKDFITAAISHHKREITVIHGKGEGVLKTEVLRILSEFAEVTRIVHETHGGAVVVYFRM